MEDAKAVDALLQWLGDLLDRMTGLLAKVGIDLAPLWLQFFLLVLVAGLLVPAVKRLRPRKKADRVPLVAVIALALVALGVVIGLVDNATTPGRVAGTLRSDRLADTRMALLDFRDRTVSSGSGLADTASGRFALHYSPLVARSTPARMLCAPCPRSRSSSRSPKRCPTSPRRSTTIPTTPTRGRCGSRRRFQGRKAALCARASACSRAGTRSKSDN